MCIQVNNTVAFSNHTHTSNYKEIQNKIHVNNKPKVLSNAMFRLSPGLGVLTFIIEQTDSINN